MDTEKKKLREKTKSKYEEYLAEKKKRLKGRGIERFMERWSNEKEKDEKTKERAGEAK